MQFAAGRVAGSAGQVAKSTRGHRASRTNGVPMPMPSPLGRSALAPGGPPIQDPQFVMPRFVGQGSHSSNGGDGPAGVDLLCHRVVPPAGLVHPVSQDFIGDETQVHLDDELSGAMNSGTYFSNLMSKGLSDPFFPPVQPADTRQADHIPQAEHIGAQNHGASAVKGPQGRSKNFSVDEDILLVSAWLNVTLDPIQGVDQSRSTYWKRIHDYFHTNKEFDSDHSQSSLLNRWSGILHDVNVFAGCLSKIEAKNHSGWSVDDKLSNACAMFKAEDKLHRNFPYMHCWKILKDKPKWMNRLKQNGSQKHVTKKQKTMANSSPSSAPLNSAANVDGTQCSEGAQERPAGRKKEKQKLRQRSSMEAVDYLMEKKKETDVVKDLKKGERCNKAFALQKERNRIEKEKVELKRELEEERIMNIDMSTLSYKQQEYYEGRQREILAKRFNF